MSARRPISLGFALLVLLAGTGRAFAQSVSDLNLPDRRRPVVEMAERLASQQASPALPLILPEPFAPPGFDTPDPDERAAAQAAARTAAATATAAPTQAAPLTDRQLLEAVASRVTPSGMIEVGSTPLLMFRRQVVRIGAVFTVHYQGSTYDLKLTGIDRTTFTLRLNREEITRPIQPGKTP